MVTMGLKFGYAMSFFYAKLSFFCHTCNSQNFKLTPLELTSQNRERGSTHLGSTLGFFSIMFVENSQLGQSTISVCIFPSHHITSHHITFSRLFQPVDDTKAYTIPPRISYLSKPQHGQISCPFVRNKST
jgi:hypothetical protein